MGDGVGLRQAFLVAAGVGMALLGFLGLIGVLTDPLASGAIISLLVLILAWVVGRRLDWSV